MLLLFCTIQTLKMFLRTSYRISLSYYTRSTLQPFQEGVQGNGAAPPILLIISILLIRYLYSSKFVSISRTTITQVTFQLAGFLYIDDTDLVTLNNRDEFTTENVVRV